MAMKSSATLKHDTSLLSRFLGEIKDENNMTKTSLFRNNYLLNPDNYFYIKLSMKDRHNNVGVSHSSARLISRAIGDDF